MTDYKFGDLICYRTAETHDEPLMYVGPCGHRKTLRPWSEGLIDILTLSGGWLFDLDHKDPSMWQKCWHEFDER